MATASSIATSYYNAFEKVVSALETLSYNVEIDYLTGLNKSNSSYDLVIKDFVNNGNSIALIKFSDGNITNKTNSNLYEQEMVLQIACLFRATATTTLKEIEQTVKNLNDVVFAISDIEINNYNVFQYSNFSIGYDIFKNIIPQLNPYPYRSQYKERGFYVEFKFRDVGNYILI